MIAVITGVSGSGKSHVGAALAQRMGWRFIDADAYHPPANVRKMAAGIPLNDDDRRPWLLTLRALMDEYDRAGVSAVLACSALKRAYRNLLDQSTAEVSWIYLKGGHDDILRRMKNRAGHIMKPDMLQSQFDALEEPDNAFIVDAMLSLEAQVALLSRTLQAWPATSGERSQEDSC